MGKINWKNKCWVTTIFLVNAEGKVLLTWNKNLQAWIPVGGHIDPGENPVQAIQREVKEETNLKFEFVPEIKDCGEVELTAARVQMEKVPHHNQHINIVFYGKCLSELKKDATDEEEKLKWFSLDELIAKKQEILPSVYNRAIVAIKRVKFN